MKNDAIRWHTFPRDVLPELLLGGCPSPSPNDTYSTPYGLSGTGIAVGRVESRHDAEYNPPALLVLGNESAVETLSWLKVYAPETHPLSQYARWFLAMTGGASTSSNRAKHRERMSGHRLCLVRRWPRERATLRFLLFLFQGQAHASLCQ